MHKFTIYFSNCLSFVEHTGDMQGVRGVGVGVKVLVWEGRRLFSS